MKILQIIFISALLITASRTARAQNETRAVKAVIHQFFEGLEKGDTTLLMGACTQAPVFQTYMADKSGNMRVMTQPFEDLVRFVGMPKNDQYDEQIRFEKILIEPSLASVWTPYVFYLNGKISHCGTNSFQLVKTNEGWKIQYILDTRRKQGCR